ncbi:MAG: NUDIX domain-containing protein [Chloroflexota bacterium]
MKILTEIHRSEGINIHGKTIYRTAVRGVILRERDLLMVLSSAVGDYKFPGGGVDEGESYEHALRREVQEECGVLLKQVGDEIGAVLEYNFSKEPDYDLFKMTSHYYYCAVQGDFGAQKLDDYERELGFMPVWIDIDQAVQENKRLLNALTPPAWLRREIYMLEYLKKNLFN